MSSLSYYSIGEGSDKRSLSIRHDSVVIGQWWDASINDKGKTYHASGWALLPKNVKRAACKAFIKQGVPELREILSFIVD